MDHSPGFLKLVTAEKLFVKEITPDEARALFPADGAAAPVTRH